MADGLFDNRYRYDYIYPRGRSGETLRAVDTENNNRPVVIKRPAPNDAPPIRAGQEVSILNERKALVALQDHPVATAYVDSGQFSVGGMPHQYIVMERAEGTIIEQDVLEAARTGERLPLLEVLVVMDRLLDLLDTAHSQDIVYNDVDAKHLFWDRERYQLKVIDWGNSVFLEGDRVTPQGISRQTDISQVGELLYFIFTGGRRADIPRDAGEDFLLDFGDDNERIPLELRQIVSRAAHPNTRYRYQMLRELQRDLTRHRQPLERERDTVLNRVIERLRHELSKTQLQSLLEVLEPAVQADPAHPTAREAKQQIIDRMRDLEVSADLDAVMIYMRGENWQRAVDLLAEMRGKTGPQTRAQVELLSDSALLLMDTTLVQAPQPIKEALIMIYEGQVVRAAHTLLTTDQPDDAARRLQWLMAERVSSRVPDVLLLRPNLYRLSLALNAVGVEGVNLSEARSLLTEINAQLDVMPGQDGSGLVQLRDEYRDVVDKLGTLNQLLSTLAVQEQLSNRHLPLSSLDRAINAAMALADNMHVIGKQAVSSPRDALAALDNSHHIDPVSPLWGMIRRMLSTLYEMLQGYQTYVPNADGSDLEGWLKASYEDLKPYESRLFDELLVEMVDGLKTAIERWNQYGAAVVQGQRVLAVQTLNSAMQAVGTLSPTLASWINQLRSVVEGSDYIERHALFGGLGRALADGWEAFDRGRLADAERLGSQAQEIARAEVERLAAARLFNLSNAAREWIDRSGINSPQRTHQTAAMIDKLFTQDEAAIRDDFAAQMPGKEPYLRAMQRGMIELYNRRSGPGLRLYFFQAILLGALEAYDGNLDDALFWRDAAIQSLGEHGPRHVASRTLDEFVSRRRDIEAANKLLSDIIGKHAIENLTQTRRSIEENPQVRSLAPAVHALREMEAALRDWADGEFKPAGLKLENALKAIDKVAQDNHLDLTGWRTWVHSLNVAAAELHNYSRQMRQVIERRPDEPDSIVRDAQRILAERTAELLGEQHAGQLHQWYQTYESFLAVYANTTARRSIKLERLNELFRAMFIDRHPAYPLYQHWYDIVESSPEFPAPPTDEPIPRIDEAEPDERELGEREVYGSRYDVPPSQARGRGWLLGAVSAVVVLLIIVAVFMLNGNEKDGDPLASASVQTPTAAVTDRGGDSEVETTQEVMMVVDTNESETAISTLSAEDLITPTLVTPTEPTPPTHALTDTRAPSDTPPPSSTPAPTNTPLPTNTPIPTNTPTPTVPPEGVRGLVSVLELGERLLVETDSGLPWDTNLFTPGDDPGTWRLATDDDSVEGDMLLIGLPSDVMAAYYGDDAAARLRRTDVTFDFVTFNASHLTLNDVNFGMMLHSVNDDSIRVGLHIEIASPGLNAVNLYIQQGDNVEFVRQVAVNSLTGLRLRLDRDPITGSINILFNDAQVNRAPLPFVLPDTPIEPVLFVRDGGVILSVRNWRISLP